MSGVARPINAQSTAPRNRIMTSASIVESRQFLLQYRSSDDLEVGYYRRPSPRDDESHQQLKSHHPGPSGVMEPLAVDGFDRGVPQSSFWNRFRVWSCIRPRTNSARLRPWPKARNQLLSRSPVKRPRAARCLFYLVVGYLSFLGLIDIFGYVVEGLKSYFPDDIDWMLHHWGQPGEPTENWGRWPTDATGDIRPVNCHSHNDYWRTVPLYEAIYAGCTGAEADVWLVDDELYVGHRRYALAQNRTLQSLYLEPLLKLLNKQNPTTEYQPNEDHPDYLVDKLPLNGIFDVDPSQTFVLLIDFKSFGPALWRKLNEQLTALREKGYLTYFNGTSIVERPITVVGTGNAPFDLLAVDEGYRDVFFDAPLDEMADLSTHWPNPNREQDVTRSRADYRTLPNTTATSSPSQTPSLANMDPTDHQLGASSTMDLTHSSSPPTTADVYNSTNSYYASASFTRSIGRVWGSRLTQDQLQLIRGQIRGAHAHGLKVRYWGLPQWPIGLRNHVWHILIREGVDMLNVDDVRGGTQRDWRRSRSRKNG